jgi:hypothetical protein
MLLVRTNKIWISAGLTAILTEAFHGFPQYHQTYPLKHSPPKMAAATDTHAHTLTHSLTVVEMVLPHNLGKYQSIKVRYIKTLSQYLIGRTEELYKSQLQGECNTSFQITHTHTHTHTNHWVGHSPMAVELPMPTQQQDFEQTFLASNT